MVKEGRFCLTLAPCSWSQNLMIVCSFRVEGVPNEMKFDTWQNSFTEKKFSQPKCMNIGVTDVYSSIGLIRQSTLFWYKAIFVYVIFHKYEICKYGFILSIKRVRFCPFLASPIKCFTFCLHIEIWSGGILIFNLKHVFQNMEF